MRCVWFNLLGLTCKLDWEPVHGDGSDGRPRKGDIDKMHAYRDAIRYGGVHPVTAAWLLFPGRVDGAGRPAIVYPAPSTARPFGNGDVGAIRTRPGDIRRLTQLLADFLAVPYTANRP